MARNGLGSTLLLIGGNLLDRETARIAVQNYISTASLDDKNAWFITSALAAYALFHMPDKELEKLYDLVPQEKR